MANVTSQSVAQMLDKASERFAGVITKTEKAIFDSAVELIKRLDIDANGYIKNTTANLKLLSDIKSKLARFASNKEYLRGVKELAQAFDDIYKQQVAYYSSSFAQKTMGDKAKNKFAAMQRVAVANTIDGLTGAGLQTGVLDSLNKMLLKAVTSGAKYSDLVAEFRSQLISSGDSQSSLAKYAGTYATTAMTQYVGQNNKLFTDDLGTEWFEYVGSSIETTREFCNVLIEHHPYIHKSEIPDILKGEIVSQKTGEVIHVALNPKTGLPKGMIEDTTPENFQINVGGWNCRHQLVPIAKEAVPENIRKKFEKEKEMRDNPDSGYARFMRDYDAKLNRLAVMAHVTGNLPLAASVTNDLSLTFEEYVQLYNDAYTKIYSAYESLQTAYTTIVNEVKVIMAEAITNHYDDVFNKASSLLASHQWHNVTSRVQYQKEMDELSKGYTELKAMLASHAPAKPQTGNPSVPLLKEYTTAANVAETLQRLNVVESLFRNGSLYRVVDPKITIGIDRNPNHNGQTNMTGNIDLSPTRYDRVIAAFDKIAKGRINEITFDEADAMATLWHEITHNRHDVHATGDYGNSGGKLATRFMELANEYTARKTLRDFYRMLGVENMPHEDFTRVRKSTGYNSMVCNYDQLVQSLRGIDEQIVITKVREGLFTTNYAQQQSVLAQALLDGGLSRMYFDKTTRRWNESKYMYVTHTKRTRFTLADARKLVAVCEPYGHSFADVQRYIASEFPNISETP